MKITITGASGFVGRHLTSYLKEQGYRIAPLSLRNEDWSLDQNVEAIIHLAGKAHDTSNTSDPAAYFTVNRDLTVVLFNQFLGSDAKDFFYFSSIKAVADTVDDILKEDHDAEPKTPYGKSKLAAEEYLLSKKLPGEKRLFIIRPCMIHGPGNKGNLNLLYNIVQKGIPWPLAAFDNKRSFLSVDNLNFLINKIIVDNSIPSGIYNVADDRSLSTNELVTLIANSSGNKVKLLKINANIISAVAKIGDQFGLPLNSERLKKLTESYEVSNQKIKTALGINQLPFSAEQGLIKTIKSFKK